MRALAIIPARGGSKGVAGENLRLIGGKPLIAWSILRAREANEIDTVMVSTDDKAIGNIARELGAEVPHTAHIHMVDAEGIDGEGLQISAGMSDLQWSKKSSNGKRLMRRSFRKFGRAKKTTARASGRLQ